MAETSQSSPDSSIQDSVKKLEGYKDESNNAAVDTEMVKTAFAEIKDKKLTDAAKTYRDAELAKLVIELAAIATSKEAAPTGLKPDDVVALSKKINTLLAKVDSQIKTIDAINGMETLSKNATDLAAEAEKTDLTKLKDPKTYADFKASINGATQEMSSLVQMIDKANLAKSLPNAQILKYQDTLKDLQLRVSEKAKFVFFMDNLPDEYSKFVALEMVNGKLSLVLKKKDIPADKADAVEKLCTSLGMMFEFGKEKQEAPEEFNNYYLGYEAFLNHDYEGAKTLLKKFKEASAGPDFDKFKGNEKFTTKIEELRKSADQVLTDMEKDEKGPDKLYFEARKEQLGGSFKVAKEKYDEYIKEGEKGGAKTELKYLEEAKEGLKAINIAQMKLTFSFINKYLKEDFKTQQQASAEIRDVDVPDAGPIPEKKYGNPDYNWAKIEAQIAARVNKGEDFEKVYKEFASTQLANAELGKLLIESFESEHALLELANHMAEKSPNPEAKGAANEMYFSLFQKRYSEYANGKFSRKSLEKTMMDDRVVTYNNNLEDQYKMFSGEAKAKAEDFYKNVADPKMKSDLIAKKVAELLKLFPKQEIINAVSDKLFPSFQQGKILREMEHDKSKMGHDEAEAFEKYFKAVDGGTMGRDPGSVMLFDKLIPLAATVIITMGASAVVEGVGVAATVAKGARGLGMAAEAAEVVGTGAGMVGTAMMGGTMEASLHTVMHGWHGTGQFFKDAGGAAVAEMPFVVGGHFIGKFASSVWGGGGKAVIGEMIAVEKAVAMEGGALGKAVAAEGTALLETEAKAVAKYARQAESVAHSMEGHFAHEVAHSSEIGMKAAHHGAEAGHKAEGKGKAFFVVQADGQAKKELPA